jgi:hypothetical protein
MVEADLFANAMAVMASEAPVLKQDVLVSMYHVDNSVSKNVLIHQLWSKRTQISVIQFTSRRSFFARYALVY